MKGFKIKNIIFFGSFLVNFFNINFAIAATTSAVTANTSSNILVDVLCNLIIIATGNAGKAFAAIAIISVGIGFFTGKVSWGLMVGVAAGIAAMFGAPQIVAAISGRDSTRCS